VALGSTYPLTEMSTWRLTAAGNECFEMWDLPPPGALKARQETALL
jgi:hypothetical protein